jgi:hypothetical protein
MTDSIANTGDQLPQRMPVAADLMLAPSPAVLPAQLSAPTPRAVQRVLEFFTAQINNDHTRKVYLNAPGRFADRCKAHGLHQLTDVQPFHVAAFVKVGVDSWTESGAVRKNLNFS